MTGNKIFLDTSYVIALCSLKDEYHKQAEAISIELERNNTELFTTKAVVLEIANALSKRKYRGVAIELINYLEVDPNNKIIPLSEDLYRRGLILYQERLDKEWSLTDCISFIVMKDYSLVYALTSDKHFQQAGFHALLLQQKD